MGQRDYVYALSDPGAKVDRTSYFLRGGGDPHLAMTSIDQDGLKAGAEAQGYNVLRYDQIVDGKHECLQKRKHTLSVNSFYVKCGWFGRAGGVNGRARTMLLQEAYTWEMFGDMADLGFEHGIRVAKSNKT